MICYSAEVYITISCSIADTSEFDALEKNPTAEEMLAAPNNANRLFYIIAFSMSFAIVFVAIVMHYIIE